MPAAIVRREMTSEPRPIELEFVAHAEVALGPLRDLGMMPAGHRRVIPIVGGTIIGPSIRATILDEGADWQIVAPDGTAVIDTRYGAVTEAGHHLFIATRGFRHAAPEVVERLVRGEPVDPEEYTFRLSVAIECSAPELAWMNHTVFVATAARGPALVTYDLYALR
jgi:Protein of unknown function (DUF3237)